EGQLRHGRADTALQILDRVRPNCQEQHAGAEGALAGSVTAPSLGARSPAEDTTSLPEGQRSFGPRLPGARPPATASGPRRAESTVDSARRNGRSEWARAATGPGAGAELLELDGGAGTLELGLRLLGVLLGHLLEHRLRRAVDEVLG